MRRPLPGEHLRAILDEVSDGVFVVDRDMRIVEFNRAAERLTGFRRSEALGMTCTDVLNNRSCGRLCQITQTENCAIRRTIASGRQVRREETEVHTRDGRHRVFRITTSPMLSKEHQPEGVAVVFNDVTELRHLREELRGRYALENLIGKSPAMQEVFRLVELAADSDASVLLEGETGTGKDHVARTIHHLSHRSAKPFVQVNCSALPETLLESELFGHVRGAFTGAVSDKVGRFQLAHGGTVVLDEISEVSPLIQLKLLRFTEERIFERVGESTPIRVDVRIITTTNRDLRQLVAEGRFREDLYYRLRVLPIYLAPLRERKGDLPLLIQHFVQHYQAVTGKAIEGPDDAALAAMLEYPWPGNVRELQHAIEHAFVRCRMERFTLDDLPVEIRHPHLAIEHLAQRRAGAARRPPMPRAPDDPERERATIRQVLQSVGGNRERAADLLGIGRTTLWRRMKKYGLL